jgi:hypothetical protein
MYNPESLTNARARRARSGLGGSGVECDPLYSTHAGLAPAGGIAAIESYGPLYEFAKGNVMNEQ